MTTRTRISLTQAVVVASAMHAAAMFALRRHQAPVSEDQGRAPRAALDDSIVDIESDSPADEGVNPRGHEPAPSRGPLDSVGRMVARQERPARRLPHPAEGVEGEVSEEDRTAGSALGEESGAASSTETRSPGQRDDGQGRINLGLGPSAWTRWMPRPMGSAAASIRPSPNPERTEGYSTTGGLREALEAHDQELGLGPGGSVLSAARTAAHSEIAPAIGRASFIAIVLRDGTVTVSLESCNSGTAGWTKVAEEMRKELARKPPTIQPGREGVRIMLEVTAEERWPNGSDVKGEAPHLALELPKVHATDEALEQMKKQNPVAAGESSPDPSVPPLKITVEPPGLWLKGRGKVCSYAVGITPTGLSLSAPCDPSNIGAKAVRVVGTRILKQSPI